MHTILNLQLLCVNCPAKMTIQQCPAFNYILSKPELFNQSVNEHLITMAKPFDEESEKYTEAFLNIFTECKQCQNQGR